MATSTAHYLELQNGVLSELIISEVNDGGLYMCSQVRAGHLKTDNPERTKPSDEQYADVMDGSVKQEAITGATYRHTWADFKLETGTKIHVNATTVYYVI